MTAPRTDRNGSILGEPPAEFAGLAASMVSWAYKAQSRYLNEFFSLSCSRDLLEWEVFPNFKEVTESFAAYRAVEKHLRHLPWCGLDDRGVTLLAVGDGASPRTATTFALRSAWDCHSVDPGLREKWERIGVRRLTLHRQPIEEVTISTSLVNPSTLVIFTPMLAS